MKNDGSLDEVVLEEVEKKKSGFKTLNVEAKMWKSSRMMACKLVSFTKTRTPEKDHVWLGGVGWGRS